MQHESFVIQARCYSMRKHQTSIDYEHKQSAISLLSFILKFRPKRFLEPIKVLHNFMESLILAQDERWRRA